MVFSVESGLSQNSVNAISQDTTGFIWMATQDGLNRFDGFRFQTFRREFSVPSSLPNNHIRCLLTDPQNRLWVGTFGGGIGLIAGRSDSVRRLTLHPESADPPSDEFINTLIQLNDSTVVAGTRHHGLVRWDTRHFQPTLISFLPGQSVTFLEKLAGGHLLVSTEKRGIWKYDPATAYNKRIWPISGNPSADIAPVNTSLLVQQDLLLIGTESGLILLNPETGQSYQPSHALKIPELKSARVSVLYRDSRNRIWVGTNGNGLFRYSPVNQQLHHFQPRNNDPATINDQHIRDILEDKRGNIWIGTYSGGVSKISESAIRFAHYRDQSTHNNSVVSIYANRESGKIWAGTFGDGLMEIDTRANTIRRIYPSPATPSSEILALSRLPNKDYLLLGTYDGLYVYHFSTGKVLPGTTFHPSALLLKGKRIRSITTDKQGTTWITAFGSGLYAFSPGSKQVTRYSTGSADHPFPTDDLISVLASKSGELWIGTYGHGLIRMRPGTPYLQRYLASELPQGLNSNFILGLHEDGYGRIWIGTRDGLNYFDPATDRFHQFRQSDGLSNNITYGILSDSKKRIWVSTNSGLTLLSPTDTGFVLTNFDVSDGLQSREFNTGAYFSTGNWFLFGGINGINLFDPGTFTGKQPPARLVLTSMTIGRQLQGLPRQSPPAIVLPSGTNDFSVEFSLLEYINAEKNRFRYQLKGYDAGWITAGNRRFLSYTNLPPGQYDLLIQGTDIHGTWYEPGLSMPVMVETPLWRSPLAYLVYLGLAGFSIYGFVVLWGKRLEHENRVLEERIREKTAELQNRTIELSESYEQLRLSQAHLIQSEKMASLGTLVAGVAHEINNPVNFISSSIEPLRKDVEDLKQYMESLEVLYQLIRETGPDSEREQRIAQAVSEIDILDRRVNPQELFDELNVLLLGIESGTQRTAEIVKSLRNFSRSDSRDKKVYDIHEGLESTIRILSKEIERGKIELIRFYGNIETISCFPGQLNQVFMNLLMNAIQALEGRPDGRIEITTNDTPSTVVITIQDNGPGIEKAIQNRIFDPFFTTKEVGKGTGMGLSITYSIIKNHNGTIQVVSEPGRGTGFVISLPKHSE